MRHISNIINRREFALITIFFISFAIYIPSIHNELIWDDILFVEGKSNFLKTKKIEFSDFVPDRDRNLQDLSSKYFRPLFVTSLILDNRIWGDSPKGFHLSNVILHSIATLLLYPLTILLCRAFGMIRRDKVAFLASIIFAVYPLHVESVSFISARGDIIAFILFSLGFIFYILSEKKYLLIIIAIFLLYLSFLAKEVALSFPLIFLGFDLITGRAKKLRYLVGYVFLLSIIVIYIYTRPAGYISLTNLFQDETIFHAGGIFSLWDGIVYFLNSYFLYVKMLVYPFDLNHFMTVPNWSFYHLFISLLSLSIVLLLFIFSLRKKDKITAFCLLWIFATLGPAVIIAIYPISINRFAERFVYLPSAGYCILLSCWFFKLSARIVNHKIAKKFLSIMIFGALFFSFAVVTLSDQKVWQDEIVFWENAIQKSPSIVTPRILYGDALGKRGKVKEAINQYYTALKPEIVGSDSVKSIAARKLGGALLDINDISNAEYFLNLALKYDREYLEQYNLDMGILSLKKNDETNAEIYLKEYLKYKPDHSRAQYLLGYLYFVQASRDNSTDKYKLSKMFLLNSLKRNPNNMETRIILARVYLALGEEVKAREEIEFIIRNSTDNNLIKEARNLFGTK